jgi:DNA repair and recombination protein RAD54B
LKNLFSYREAICDTHDLLDCPCNGNGVVVEKDLLTKEHETVEDELELGFLPASQLKDEPKVSAQKSKVDKKKKHKFDALHEFWHFDPQRFKDKDDDEDFLCDIIHDDVLRKVVETHLSSDKLSSISYLFGVKRGS